LNVIGVTRDSKFGEEADAVKAGCDVVMIPTDLDGAFHGIVDAVRKGEISESRIDESVRKILEMKASVGLHKSRFVDLNQVSALTTKPEDMNFAQHISDEATTLVRNDGVLLPLGKATSPKAGMQTVPGPPDQNRRLVAVVLGETLTRTDGQEFERELKSRRRLAEQPLPENLAGELIEGEIAANSGKDFRVFTQALRFKHPLRKFAAAQIIGSRIDLVEPAFIFPGAGADPDVLARKRTKPFCQGAAVKRRRRIEKR